MIDLMEVVECLQIGMQYKRSDEDILRIEAQMNQILISCQQVSAEKVKPKTFKDKNERK